MSKERSPRSGQQLDSGILKKFNPLSRAQHLVDQGIRPSGKDLRAIVKTNGIEVRDDLLRGAAGSEEYPILTGWGRFRIGKWRPFAPRQARLDPLPIGLGSIDPKDPEGDPEAGFWKLYDLHKQRRVTLVETVEEATQADPIAQALKTLKDHGVDVSPIINPGGLISTGISRARGDLNVITLQAQVKHDLAGVTRSRAKASVEADQLVSEVLGKKVPIKTVDQAAKIPVTREGKALAWLKSHIRSEQDMVSVEPSESSLKSKARRVLQRVFKLQVKNARSVRVQPKLYEATRDETRQAIANIDSTTVHAVAEGISDESLLTNTATNRRLMTMFKLTKQQIREMGQEDKARLKAAKIILTSITRSKAAHKARGKKKTVDNSDWTDSQVALEQEYGTGVDTTQVDASDPMEDEYERTDPGIYVEKGPGGSSRVVDMNGFVKRPTTPSGSRNGSISKPALQPQRSPRILNARGSVALGPVNSVLSEEVVSTQAQVGVMDFVGRQDDLEDEAIRAAQNDDRLRTALGRVQMSSIDYMSVAGMFGEGQKAPEGLEYQIPNLDVVLDELSEYGKARVRIEQGRLQAEIDYSDPIVRAALGAIEIDLDRFDIVLKENKLVVSELVTV